jgi:hypothetical protein
MKIQKIDSTYACMVTRLAIFRPMLDSFLLAVFETNRSSQHFCATVFLSMGDVLILTKNGLGCRRFFPYSSGHPDSMNVGM